MAKTLSKINVETGEVVEAHHVSQSIDAFTGTEAYDITLSGSLTVTGSTSLDTLNIQNLGTGSSTVFLGLDSLGNVVTGSTPPTPSEIVEFDTEDPNLGGTVFTPDSQQAANTLYVSTDADTTGQTWIWNSSTNLYDTYEADIPNNTPFWLYNTTIDAGGNKTAFIQRNGPILINSAPSNGSRYAGYFYSRRTSAEGNGMLIRRDFRQTSGYGLLVQRYHFGNNTDIVNQLRVNHDGSLLINDAYTLPNIDGTAGQYLKTDGNGIVSWDSNALLGRILFVSENGNDATGTIGDINKPFATLNAARNAASSGDTVYVFPQTIIYDNRDSNGNAWNGRQAEMNLWKDGVTYYFCPGVNIKIYNQTVTGQYLYLFRPNGDTYETCTVRGHLRYEQFGAGANSSNGHIYYFNGLAIGTDLGYNFDSEVDYMFTDTTQILSIERQSVSIVDDTVITKIRIKAREVFKTYSAGNTGVGTWCVIRAGDHQLRYDEIIENFTNVSTINLPFIHSFRDNLSKTVINITGKIYASDSRFFDIRSNVAGGVINYNVTKSYFGLSSTASYVGIIINTWNYATAAVTFNLNSDFEQIANSNSNATLFYLANTTHILNLKGDIITKTATTEGHRIIEARNLSTVNIEGNIIYSGSGATSSNTFYVDHDSVITFKGNISGNFTGAIAQFQRGFINIYDAVIDLNTLSTTAQLLFSALNSQNHYLRLYNSKVIFNNDTVPVFNCNHTTFLASNSQLINIGTGGGISNTISDGLIQLINTFVIVNSGDAINITTQPLVSLNSAVNTSYIAPALDGSISILTTLTY